MSRIATVIPEDGLRLRGGPGTDAEILGLLAMGQQVTVTARRALWRRVETSLGAGYVHGDFLTVDGQLTCNEEPPGLDIEIPDADLREPDDRTGEPQAALFYTVLPDETLSIIGGKLGLNWLEIAAANGITHPFVIVPNQVLRLPGAALRVAAIQVRNPMPGVTLVTSSSAQGHHTPYGGTQSVDLDVIGVASAGTPARFLVDTEPGVELRGIVRSIGFACRSGRVGDGGQKVQISIEHRASGGEWQRSGAWVLYAHLDPVLVSVDEVVMPGEQIGCLGPNGGGEYDSSCAQGSHVHVEATRGRWAIPVGSEILDGSVIEVLI